MLRTLKTFVAVHRDGTFSRAGDQLGLTQSAVSAQIKKLEDHLHAELFVRGQRYATLTDAGRRLMPLAEQVLELVAQMPHQVRDGTPAGRLRIGAIATAQVGLLPDVLVQYRAQFPQVDLHISPGVSSVLLDWVDAGEIDLAVLVRPPFSLPRELRWHSLWSEPYGLLVPASVEQTSVQDVLLTQQFIRYDRRSYGGRHVHGFLTRQRITVRDTMELDDLEAIVRMVERGLGVALIPLSATLELKRPQLRVVGLGKNTFYREIGVVERRSQEPDALRNAFLEAIKRNVPSGTGNFPA